MTKFFTYGTFMRGQVRHQQLLDLGAKFIAPAKTYGLHYLFRYEDGGFPVMMWLNILTGKPNPAKVGHVMGECYEVPPQAFETLDYIEGEGTLYQKHNVEVVYNQFIGKDSDDERRVYCLSYLGIHKTWKDNPRLTPYTPSPNLQFTG